MMTSMNLTLSNTPSLRASAMIKAQQPRVGLGSPLLAPAKRCVVRRGNEQFHGDKAGVPRPDLNQNLEQVSDVKGPGIDQRKTENIQPGNISSENAERRADIGATRPPTLLGQFCELACIDCSAVFMHLKQSLSTALVSSHSVFAEAQSFDGPVPETVNGRLAMLGITSALAAEFATGVGLREQWLKAPGPILFSFAIIAIASYVPVLKGFTRYKLILFNS